MKRTLPIILNGLVAAVLMAVPARADYLKNSDLKNGLEGWHGDGVMAYLKQDGTEGAEDDVDVKPAIKIFLSRNGSRSVYQEFETRDHPTDLFFKVNILPSSNFQPSKSYDDYSKEVSSFQPGDYLVWSGVAVFKVDFWIRGGPDGPNWLYQMADSVTVGKWSTVLHTFKNVRDDMNRTVYFCVPPGQGAIYIQEPLVAPKGP